MPINENYFYGAGEGSDKQQSKLNALNYIATQIQTTISSNFSINESDINGEIYRNIQNKITAEVKNFDFVDIEIIEIVKVDNQFYTLLRVNKNKLFNHLKTKFELLDKNIDNEISLSQNYSLLEQLNILNKETKNIEKALSLASILNTLKVSFDIQKYADKYSKYLNKKDELLHKISFNVVTQDIFGNKLIEVLNNQGYKVSNSNIKIKLSEHIDITKPYGLSVAKVLINIKVIANNKVLNSISIQTKGIGNNKKQALISASNDFKTKLLKLGVNKLIFK